jgi:murein DD-endopeptidase MepM/ murein hydrolase activator NlpD
MEIDKRYIAGFIDGEGYISVVRHKDVRVKKGHTLYPIFRITNSNKEALEKINEFIKGDIRTNGNDKNYNHKQVYRIEVIDQKKIRDILNKIIPYLIIRKKQAELLLNFCNKRIKAKSKNYTDDDFKLVPLFSKLNKRGR